MWIKPGEKNYEGIISAGHIFFVRTKTIHTWGRHLGVGAVAPHLRASLLRAPLCPAGHLPHEGGDRLSRWVSPIAGAAEWARRKRPADLPPCGGDVRQDRGGREGAETVPRVASPRCPLPCKFQGLSFAKPRNLLSLPQGERSGALRRRLRRSCGYLPLTVLGFARATSPPLRGGEEPLPQDVAPSLQPRFLDPACGGELPSKARR